MSDGPKYRQRGYKDSEDRGAPSARGPQAPREKKEGPRGRGFGTPSETVFRCSACSEKRPLLEEVPIDATCNRCGADLHTCSNCINFDTSVHWECRRFQEIPARVAKKRDRNDCPLFTPKATQEFAKDSDKPSPGDARSAFDALFKF
jgi:hypothetical protein